MLTDEANAVNIYGVIAGESTDDNSNNRTVVWADQEQSAQKASSIERTVPSSHQVLQANKICVDFAHTLQGDSVEALRDAALVAACILNVSQFVRDDEGEFPFVVLEDFYQRWGEVNCAAHWIRVRVKFYLVRDDDVKD